MHAPLACKLSQLFVVLAKDHLESALVELLARFDHHRLLDEETDATNNGFLGKSLVTENISDHEADGIVISVLLTRFDHSNCV